MEREKQKQVEREKEKKDREEFLKHKKLEEDQTPQTKPDDSVPKMPTKSKFVIFPISRVMMVAVLISHFKNIKFIGY